MAADLTPELLEQLELAVKESTRCEYATDCAIREMRQVVEPWLYDHLARLFAAAPALVAAAKERDQLRRQLDGSSLGAMRRQIAHLEERQQSHLATIAKLSQTTPFAEEVAGWEGQRAKMIAEVGTLRAEISDIRGALDAHGQDGTFEAAARLRDETVKLRAEVERLRKRGIECLVLLDAVTEGEPWARKATDGELPRLRAEIEGVP